MEQYSSAPKAGVRGGCLRVSTRRSGQDDKVRLWILAIQAVVDLHLLRQRRRWSSKKYWSRLLLRPSQQEARRGRRYHKQSNPRRSLKREEGGTLQGLRARSMTNTRSTQNRTATYPFYINQSYETRQQGDRCMLMIAPAAPSTTNVLARHRYGSIKTLERCRTSHAAREQSTTQ